MYFTQKPLCTRCALQLMIDRGLSCADTKRAIRYLSHVGYYRFNGYARFFYNSENCASPVFYSGTTFEKIWRIYCFDRELRLLTLDAVERIEVAIRTVISDSLSIKNPSAPNLPYGSHWFMEDSFYKDPVHRKNFCLLVEKETGKNNSGRQNLSTKHYYNTYSSPALPPSWIIMESLSMGSWVTVLKNLKQPVQKYLAAKFELNHILFISWISALRVVRNIAAHHGRFWKRTLVHPFKVPQPHYSKLCPDFRAVADSYYAAACISWFFLLKIAPNSHWPKRLKDLFEKYSEVSCADLKFPLDWYNDPFWKISF